MVVLDIIIMEYIINDFVQVLIFYYFPQKRCFSSKISNLILDCFIN